MGVADSSDPELMLATFYVYFPVVSAWAFDSLATEHVIICRDEGVRLNLGPAGPISLGLWKQICVVGALV